MATNGNGKAPDIQVTPDELSQFAKQIRDLLPDVQDAKTNIDKVSPVAGNFADANAFRDLVGFGTAGGGGRASAYSQHLGELNLALSKFADKLDTMVTNYTTTETLNQGLADKIKELAGEIEPLLPGKPA